MNAPSALSRPAAGSYAPLQRAAALVGLLLATLLIYTFLHESGHALVGLAFGGELTSFSVNFWELSAHAGLKGNFTDGQRTLIALAGVSLPLLVWTIFMALVPKKADPLLEWFKLTGSMGTLNTLLAWMIIPFLYLAGRAPSDDSTNFLVLSGMQPLHVAGLALVAYLYGWVLFLHKVGGLPGLRARLRANPLEQWRSSSRATLVALVALTVTAALISAGVARFYPFADMLAGPDGYQQAFRLNLSDQAYQSATVHRFRLTQDSQVSLFIALRNVTRGPVQITLRGPQGYENTFLAGDESFYAGQATVHPRGIPLEKGTYWLVVSFPQTSGEVSGYWLAVPELE